ncbi:uncharacterized protein LOC133393834 [Anopheles gambiae]|uniref:uncharacterized protein LOC120957106 n=1 Tax=Anopheles coluzzii TaxID=1518534 RepID=UPI0020FFC781|nr:uncharacterized protein LOC120957106 [Anopheles coluzzii]XP_049462028.1 uncharacterized protein LOC125906586 [Anopheles coluzzii]XP_061516572.1 uncharacterized protein LOC133393834 [Anopheles gambiae]
MEHPNQEPTKQMQGEFIEWKPSEPGEWQFLFFEDQELKLSLDSEEEGQEAMPYSMKQPPYLLNDVLRCACCHQCQFQCYENDLLLTCQSHPRLICWMCEKAPATPPNTLQTTAVADFTDSDSLTDTSELIETDDNGEDSRLIEG